MPQETEIIFVFTVNKNANISYMPGLFNHPSKIKLKRKFKENNQEVQSWKRAPYFAKMASTDITPENFSCPERSCLNKMRLSFSICHSPRAL